MKSCETALDAVILREAHEIDPEILERLEAHLRLCPACAGEAARIRGALDQVRAAEVPRPGADYWAAFGARLRGRIRRRRATRRWQAVMGLAAALVAAAGLWLFAAGRWRAPAPGTLDDAAKAAEERLEESIHRLALEDEGDRSFEAVLDEVLPAGPLASEGDPETQDVEPPPAHENC